MSQPSFCPSRDRQHPPRAFPDRVSLAQANTRRPRAQHGPNLALTAVQTRRGFRKSYGRYSAFVSNLSQSPSHSRAQAPTCHDAHTPHHDTRTCGCVFPHADRHLPYTQRPHTCGSSHTRPFTHACHFTHAHHTTHTHGDTRTGETCHHRGSQGLYTVYPPSSVCTCPQHSPPLTSKARPDSPGRDPLQGGILPPLVPEGGYPAAGHISKNS